MPYRMSVDGRPWTAVTVESEMKVDLHGDSPMVLLVQRMRCDEILHAVVLDGPKNSFIQGFRFDIVQTVRSEDSITFYGRKGVFVRICIGEVPVKKDRRPAFMNGCGSAK